MNRQSVQVRIKRTYGNPGVLLGTIKRILKAKDCGNFNPIFCIYHGKEHLVSSFDGDLSDPFRRTESYLKTLYIEV